MEPADPEITFEEEYRNTLTWFGVVYVHTWLDEAGNIQRKIIPNNEITLGDTQ